LVRHCREMNRFFVNPNQIEGQVIRIVRKEDLHHIKTVLRLRAGECIEVSDGVQWEYEAMLGQQDPDGLKLEIISRTAFAREPNVHITLFQGIPKQGKMDFIIQKSVELGASEVVPVFMARTVVSDKGNFGKKLIRYEMISEEAAAQCGRGIIPFIRQAIPFSKILEALEPDSTILFLYENEKNTTIKEVLRGLPTPPKRLALIVGPEGGFADEEAEFLKKQGFPCVTLGKTILRTETAGLAALAMCMYELEL
jgi:16S rRNA (uracil1498-N3)-methyltransferase